MIPSNNCKISHTNSSINTSNQAQQKTAANSKTASSSAVQSLSSQPQHNSAADPKAMVLVGRNVTLCTHHDLSMGTHSFIDKIILQLGFNAGMDLVDLKTSAAKLLRPMMPMFQQMEQMMSKIDADKEDLALTLQNGLQAEIHKLSSQMHKKCALAGVQSHSELVQKQKMIEGFKSLAWQKLCSDPKSITLKATFDEALVVACMGELSAKNRKTIQDYWGLIAADADGYNLHNKQEERFSIVLLELVSTELAAYLKSVSSQVNMHGDVPLEGLAKSLYAALQTKEEQLRKTSAGQSEKEQILTEYLILQGRLVGPTLINMQLRKFFEDRVQEKEEYAEHMLHSFVLPFDKQDIESCKQKMSEDRWGPSIIRARKHGLEEYAKEIEARVEEDKAFYAKMIAEIQNRDPKAYAYRLCGTHPNEIRKLIPKDTQYEKMVRLLFKLTPEAMSKKGEMSLSTDLQLDLSKLANPVDYFLKQMVAEEMEKLKIVQSSQKVNIELM